MDNQSPTYLIIACGALAKEIVFLKKQLGLDDNQVELTCLPAKFHNTPARIAPAVETILKKRRDNFSHALIGYGECGTGGELDKILEKYDASRIAGAHCYEFFAGSSHFEAIVDEEIGSFFLTDYLLKNFDRLVIEGLGLDRYPHLRGAYFGNYKKLVYLAQFEEDGLKEKAQAAADRLGLELDYRFVGFGELGDLFSDIAAKIKSKEAGHV